MHKHPSWDDPNLGAAHWKANHDQQVARARVLVERTDMPLERVRAYQQIGELIAERDELHLDVRAMTLALVDTKQDKLLSRALAALQWYIAEDDTHEWQEGNEYWVEGKRNAESVVADLQAFGVRV